MSKSNFFGNLIKTNPTLPTANSGANYGTATGIWTLEEAGAFRAAGDWPIPASAPGAPSITSVTSGDEQVIVAFSGNADTGGLDPTSFTALASSGESASGSSSPLTVTGLTNDTAITFTVTATNAVGTSSASSASSSVTPAEPINGFFITGTNGGTRKSQVDSGMHPKGRSFRWNLRLQHGQRDVEEALHGVGAVHLRRLVEGGRHRLQRGEEGRRRRRLEAHGGDASRRPLAGSWLWSSGNSQRHNCRAIVRPFAPGLERKKQALRGLRHPRRRYRQAPASGWHARASRVVLSAQCRAASLNTKPLHAS